MKLRHRRLLYLTFFLIFFICGPILILDTTGYRYNLKKNTLEKTGILVLNSQPENAEIILNGKYKDQTPARLTKLLPDQYNIEVKKDGYQTWRQKLEVKSNLTTFDEDIVLFKNNLPTIKVQGEINTLATATSPNKIIYSIKRDDWEELRFLNPKTDIDLLIEKSTAKTYDQLQFVAWSGKKNKALFKKVIDDFNQYLIVDTETLKVKELFNITRLNFDKVDFDQENDGYLYAAKGSVLYQIDLTQNSTKIVASDKIVDFLVRGREIYYLTQINRENFLNQIILNADTAKSKKIKLPSPSDFTIQPAPEGKLTLINKKNNDLFIISTQVFIDENIDNNVILQAQAKYLDWAPDQKKLIYCTDFELWIYDLEKNENQLVNRFGQTINQAVWYPNGKYILYQTGKTVNAIQAYGTDDKNNLTLAELENIDKLTVDSAGENIYFVGKIGSQQGIFQLTIQ